MGEKILDKKDMYRRLTAGEFGNTAPVWDERVMGRWAAYAGANPDSVWGVRSVTPDDPRCRLNLRSYDVLPYLEEAGFCPGEFNLTEMVDHMAALKGVVYRSKTEPVGLHLTYVPAAHRLVPWRQAFADPECVRYALNSTAVCILQYYLWWDDYQWVMHLLDEYEDCVVEFTACDRAYGTVPGRNTVIWEVRNY